MTIVEERPLEGAATAPAPTAERGPMSVASWRLAARLARREVRRRPGRTVLVALLVAIPVMAMTIGAILVRSNTDETAFARSYGTADVAISQWWFSDAEMAEFDPLDFTDPATQATWPDGTTATEILSTYTTVTGPGPEPVAVTAMHRDLDSPITADLIDVHSGRPPTASDEVLLHPSVADDLGVGVGDRLVLERPDRTLLVSGLGRSISNHRDRVMVFAQLDRTELRDYRLTTLIDLPAGVDKRAFATDLARPNDSGWSPALNISLPSGNLIGNGRGPQTEALAWGWIVGVLALTALGVIIAAAFATSARRQLATVGQLAANGASPRLIRRTLSLQGTWSGVIGSLTGIAAGIGLMLLGTPVLERIVRHDWTDTTIRPLDMTILLVTGSVAATVAALLPSRSLATTSVLGALAGRRPIRPVRTATVTIGAICFVAGIFLLTVAAATSANSYDSDNNNLLAVVAVVGGVCVLAGMCLAAPLAITASTAVVSRLGATWRLAGRSLYRTRWRSAAVATAIGVAGAFAMVAGTIATDLGDNSIEEPTEMPRDQAIIRTNDFRYTSDIAAIDPAVLGEIRDVMAPASESLIYGIDLAPPTDREYTRALEDGSSFDIPVIHPGEITIADDELLDGMGLSRADRQRLDEIGALTMWYDATTPEFGPSSAGSFPSDPEPQVTRVVGSDRTVTFEAAAIEDPYTSRNGAFGFIMTRARADELNLGVIPAGIRFSSDHDLSSAERHELDRINSDVVQADSWIVGDEVADDAPANEQTYWIAYQWVDDRPSQSLIEAAIAGATLLLVLIVVAIGLSLAAAESRDERNTLIAIGASPKTLRRRSATTAVLLAATGGALAVPTGLVPTMVVMRATDTDVTVPWVSVLAVTVVIPIVVGIVAFVGSSLVQWLRPAQVIQDRVD